MRIAVPVLCTLLLASMRVALAAPSDVDGTFGTEGRTTTPAAGTVLEPGDPAVDSSGRIYVPVYGAGDSIVVPGDPPPVESYAAIVRLSPDGMLDPSFGTNGVLVLPATPAFAPRGIAIDEAEQRLIVSGAVDIGLGAPSTAGVIRLDLTGAMDPAFGTSGVATPAVNNLLSEADAVDLLDDGRILVASTDGNSISVSRLMADGSVDRTFGTNGRTGLIASTPQPLVSVLRHGGDGSIFVCGPRGLRPGVGGGPTFPDDGVRIGRLTAEGAPVESFGEDGSREVDLDGLATCVDLVPREGGAFSVLAATRSALIVARFKADGSRDTAFNGTGVESSPFLTLSSPVGTALDDGRIVLARSGGAIQTDGGEIAIFSPPGKGGIEVSRMVGSPELRPDSDATPGGDGDGGGGGGAFDVATLMCLLLFVLLRGHAGRSQIARGIAHLSRFSTVACRWLVATASLAAFLSACGGGSDSSGPPENRPPQLAANSATDLYLPAAHPFSYDARTAVVDPDHDPLTFELVNVLGPAGSHALPVGLTGSGPVIEGVTSEQGTWSITIQVADGHGEPFLYNFRLLVIANSAPAIAEGNAPKIVRAGEYVDRDAVQGGATFIDPDGDALTYAVALEGDPHGLAVSETTVFGTFDGTGAVKATITANDGYGGVASDSFLIAAPVAVSRMRPSLPSKSYVYRDEDLPLPWAFRTSSEIQIPLFDTQPPDNRTTNAGATLGRVLFYDKRLSITNTMACASCHQQQYGFASPQRVNVGVAGVAQKRNTMALANARYSIHNAWFSDIRVGGDLRNLTILPIENVDELGMARVSLESKLEDASYYPPLFAHAFGTPEITRDRIAAALAQFVQSLISYRAKLDVANNPMTTDPPNPAAVFNQREMHGLHLFVKKRCSTCHELTGTTNIWVANNGLDSIPQDPGIMDPRRLGMFRAASLRNIAVSSPYMHDGRFGTLREVIDHYDHGIQAGPYLDIVLRKGFQDGAGPIRLNLSEADKAALEAFLRTFTDKAFLNDPKFSDPFVP